MCAPKLSSLFIIVFIIFILSLRRKEDIAAASAHDFPSFSEVHPDEMKDFIKVQQDALFGATISVENWWWCFGIGKMGEVS